MDSLTADDIEFYHDRGGLETSKKNLVESIHKNICGKVTRTLAPNSIEVYEIMGYGAVEFGYHSFKNIAADGGECKMTSGHILSYIFCLTTRHSDQL